MTNKTKYIGNLSHLKNIENLEVLKHNRVHIHIYQLIIGLREVLRNINSKFSAIPLFAGFCNMDNEGSSLKYLAGLQRRQSQEILIDLTHSAEIPNSETLSQW